LDLEKGEGRGIGEEKAREEEGDSGREGKDETARLLDSLPFVLNSSLLTELSIRHLFI